MKRLFVFLTLLFLFTCSPEQAVEVGKIDWQTISLGEAQSQARESGKLLLVYFYTDG